MRSASVASLPTPPRTHHKRKRGRSKHSRATDEDLTATDDDDENLIKEAEDEESFWLATNPASMSVLFVMRSKDESNISLFDRAVIQLRNICRQPQIELFNPSSLINASYGNGLWIGKLPEELNDLTFLEEQCITQARATKCPDCQNGLRFDLNGDSVSPVSNKDLNQVVE
ncbi:hypothetical protein B0H14DRAFT_2625521 [Mycena olivaceomarginata]|nr:hypothetical protein B0H14DRAFT_2625521 [Mycena olivaceomarginata]